MLVEGIDLAPVGLRQRHSPGTQKSDQKLHPVTGPAAIWPLMVLETVSELLVGRDNNA